MSLYNASYTENESAEVMTIVFTDTMNQLYAKRNEVKTGLIIATIVNIVITLAVFALLIAIL